MKHLLLALIALTLVLSACAPAADETVISYPSVSYPSVSYPNPEESNLTMPANEFSPRPEDTALSRGNAYLDSTDLLTLESFPLQFTLHIVGNLPTPCNALRVAISPPDMGNKIVMDVYSVINPNRVCTQVLQPFDVNIPLGSFPQGNYSLWINGELVAEFQA